MTDNKDEKKIKKDVRNALVENASDTIQRYGDAVKEHLVAYSGVDNETGRSLTKSLKSINKEKVNADYQFNNVHQQAGYSAEVKETANVNANNIVNGVRKRKIRTDDIGRKNDQLFDHVEIDGNGNVIAGSGSQMKFIGASENDPNGVYDSVRAVNKLKSKKFDKYLEVNAKIDVPKDKYADMISEIDNQISKLQKQQLRVADKQSFNNRSTIQEKINKLNKIKENLRPSTVTSKEALFARNHPVLSTAKSIAVTANQLGLKGAAVGASVGGTVSLISNVVSILKGEENLGEAGINVVKDTTRGAVSGYTNYAVGSALNGVLKQSKSKLLRKFGNTNIPMHFVSITTDIGSSISKYIKGELSSMECIEQMGNDGVSMIGGTYGCLVAKALVSKEMGNLASYAIGIGAATIGSIAASYAYVAIMDAYHEAKYAREERIRIEEECRLLIQQIKQYREERDKIAEEILKYNIEITKTCFEAMDRAIIDNDSNGFIMANVQLQKMFNHKAQFTSQEEFDALMINCNEKLLF